MKRKTIVNKGYYFNDFSHNMEKKIFKGTYDLGMSGNTVGGDVKVVFTPNLSADANIFNELPEYVYENEDAKSFLNCLRNVLLTTDLNGITLSKLCVSEHTNSGLVLDWIYNYFRVYFSFDTDEGNFYGIISSNPEEGSYSNDFKTMDPKQYQTLARAIVDYVVMMIHA
jgi:hypothetical protein